MRDKDFTKIRKAYYNMKDRCFNNKSSDYHNYGGRGITVCPEWVVSLESFYNWAIENGYDNTLSLDRIENNGPYSPDNCRWVTFKKQCNNTRKTKWIEYRGKRRPMAEWAEILGIKYSTLKKRILSGDSIELAFRPTGKRSASRKNLNKSVNPRYIGNSRVCYPSPRWGTNGTFVNFYDLWND